ncbi:MAG: putative porin [Lentimicrobium sp.]|nr:putative porin [Lentimicrobium sp.]
MRNITVIGLLFVFITSGYGQQPDVKANDERSPDTATIRYLTLDQKWPAPVLIKMNDTVLDGFQFYDPAVNVNRLNAVNGNIGLAYKSLIFDPDTPEGFRFAPSVIYHYLLRNDNIRYYQTLVPFSNVAYSFGDGKEQLFSVTHSQNFARGLSIGVDLRIINSLGKYNRQKSDNSSVAIQGQFISDNERYAVLANYRNNRYKWRENGGIVNDSLFTQNMEPERNRIAINLAAADNLQKESGAFIRQYYYFGRNPGKPDTENSKSDTTLTRTDSIAVNKLPARIFFNPERSDFLRHTFTYTRNALLYTDTRPTSGYYPNIYIDSLKTFDSIFYHEFSNQFVFEGGIGKARGSGKAILLRLGFEHAFTAYKNGFNENKNDSIKRTFNRVTTFGYLAANAFGVAKAEGKIWITSGAPFNGDKGISALLTLPGFDNSTSWGNLSAELGVNALQPDYIYQYHHSNHFSWENSFGQQTLLIGKIMYHQKYFSTGFNFYNLDGYVYFDENIRPARANSSFAVNQLYGQAEIKFGNFDLQAFAVWQNSANTEILHLPALAGRVSAFYSLNLFKRALYLQTGLSLMVNSTYYADAWMPALRSYYVQNQFEAGNYPYIDGFINIRVKRARMFLVMKHLNSGLSGYNYMMVPSYPMPDRGLRFGVSWNFFD